MKKFFEGKAILLALCTTIVTLGMLKLIGLITTPIEGRFDVYVESAIGEALLAVFALGTVFYFGQRDVYKFDAKGFFRGLLCGGYFIFAGIYTLSYYGYLATNWDNLSSEVKESIEMLNIDFSGYVIQTPLHIIAFVITMLLIGIAEESLFRGLVAEFLIRQYGNSKKGIIKAVVISGLFFGALHLNNGFETGFEAAAVQAIVTSLMGMVLAVVFFKSHTLWAPIAVHAFIDFAGLAIQGGILGSPNGDTSFVSAMDYTVANLSGAIPYIIVLIIVLREKNLEIIAENYREYEK